MQKFVMGKGQSRVKNTISIICDALYEREVWCNKKITRATFKHLRKKLINLFLYF